MSDTKEVVCKFRFTAMRTAEGYDFEKKQPTLLYDLEFIPVSGTSEENKKFWQATPSGIFKFSTINAEAAKMFQFGHEYYVTFRVANHEPPKTALKAESLGVVTPMTEKVF